MTIGVMTECCSGLVLVFVFNQVFIRRQPDDLGQSYPVEQNPCPFNEIRPDPHALSWIFGVSSPTLIAAIAAKMSRTVAATAYATGGSNRR